MKELDINAQTRNALIRSTRCKGERGFALLTQRWQALQHVTASLSKITSIAKAAVVLVLFEHKMLSRNRTAAEGLDNHRSITLEADNCNPNCAQGHDTAYAVTVTLTHLAPYGNGEQAYSAMAISVSRRTFSLRDVQHRPRAITTTHARRPQNSAALNYWHGG